MILPTTTSDQARKHTTNAERRREKKMILATDDLEARRTARVYAHRTALPYALALLAPTLGTVAAIALAFLLRK
jgi:type IV secretory pathway component VirB8